MHRSLLLALALPFCLAPADTRAEGSHAPAPPVAEIVTFTLIPGSDEGAFLAAAQATEAPVAAQPGFLRRVLSRDDAGLWTDHVEWADRTSAEAAAQAVMAMPEFGPFAAFIDPSGMTMRHAQVLWTMGD
jgi:hypothetical protein